MLEYILIGNNYTDNEILLSGLEIMCKVKFTDILHKHCCSSCHFLPLFNLHRIECEQKKPFILLFFSLLCN